MPAGASRDRTAEMAPRGLDAGALLEGVDIAGKDRERGAEVPVRGGDAASSELELAELDLDPCASTPADHPLRRARAASQ